MMKRLRSRSILLPRKPPTTTTSTAPATIGLANKTSCLAPPTTKNSHVPFHNHVLATTTTTTTAARTNETNHHHHHHQEILDEEQLIVQAVQALQQRKREIITQMSRQQQPQQVVATTTQGRIDPPKLEQQQLLLQEYSPIATRQQHKPIQSRPQRRRRRPPPKPEDSIRRIPPQRAPPPPSRRVRESLEMESILDNLERKARQHSVTSIPRNVACTNSSILVDTKRMGNHTSHRPNNNNNNNKSSNSSANPSIRLETKIIDNNPIRPNNNNKSSNSSRVTFAEESTIATFQIVEDDETTIHAPEEEEEEESILGTYSGWLQSLRGAATSPPSGKNTTTAIGTPRYTKTAFTKTTDIVKGSKTKRRIARIAKPKKQPRSARSTVSILKPPLPPRLSTRSTGVKLATLNSCDSSIQQDEDERTKSVESRLSLVDVMERSESSGKNHTMLRDNDDDDQSHWSTSSFSFSTAAPTYVTETTFVTIYPFKDCLPIPLRYQCYV